MSNELQSPRYEIYDTLLSVMITIPDTLKYFIFCCTQVITGSHDSTIRLWDLAAGKTMSVLTNHKKSVRALALHPTE